MLGLCCKCWEERVTMALWCQGLSTRNLSRKKLQSCCPELGSADCPQQLQLWRLKSVEATQNLLLQCSSLDMYGDGYRGMLHDQFCTFGAYTKYHKFEMIHLHAHLSIVEFSLFLRFRLQGFSACFSAYGQRVYEAMKQTWKKLHVSWKCCVVWIVNACVCIFRASHQKPLHIICL